MMEEPQSNFEFPDSGEDGVSEEEIFEEPQPEEPQAAHRIETGGFNFWTAIQSFFAAAIVLATVFTLWTPQNFIANQSMSEIFEAGQMQATEEVLILPTFTPAPRPRIGIVAGHWGNDSGAVCSDGLTEVEVNLKIATLVQQKLLQQNLDVDLLQEKDAKLFEYQALALVSIHNDSCDYVNDQATGYKVTAAMSTIFPEKASRLTACLTRRYQETTGLQFHANTITDDMTSYHAFNEIHNQTTAAIIETGFLNLDRDILTNNTDLVADGVARGIMCYVQNEDLSQPPQSQ